MNNDIFSPYLQAITSPDISVKVPFPIQASARASLEEIKTVEQTLGRALPKSYVQFLLNWNGVSIYSRSTQTLLYILGTDGVLKATSELQEEYSYFPKAEDLIVFCEIDGEADLFCFDTVHQGSCEEEYLIGFFIHEGPQVRHYNSSFDRWLNALAMRQFLPTFLDIPPNVPVEQLLEEAVNLDGALFFPHFDLAQGLYDEGNLEAAAQVLRHAVSIAPSEYGWHRRTLDFLRRIESELPSDA